MRQLTRLYYAGLIFGGFTGEGPRAGPDSDLRAPTPAELTAAVREGRLRVGSREMIGSLGKMMLAAFLAGLDDPAFEDALVVAGQG